MSLPIRPDVPGRTPEPFARRRVVPGQVWEVADENDVRWFVLTPDRIIALFAGGSDHTPASLVHTYGDRLRLASDATNYRAHDWPVEWAIGATSSTTAEPHLAAYNAETA